MVEPTHLKKYYIVKLDHFPEDRGEIKKKWNHQLVSDDKILLTSLRIYILLEIWNLNHVKKNKTSSISTLHSWWFHPIWKICQIGISPPNNPTYRPFWVNFHRTSQTFINKKAHQQTPTNRTSTAKRGGPASQPTLSHPWNKIAPWCESHPKRKHPGLPNHPFSAAKMWVSG